MTCAVHRREEPARECLACRAYVRELDGLRAELSRLSVPPDDELAARRQRGELLARAATLPRDRVPRHRRRALVTTCAVGAIAAAVFAFSAGGGVREPRAARDPIQIEADHATWSRLDAGDTTVVRLDDGALRIHIDHGGAWHRLVVRLPDGQIDDVGTAFRVGVAAGHVNAIIVEEGAVILRRGDDRRIALVRGDRWTAQVAVASSSESAPAAPAAIVKPARQPSSPPDPISTAIDRLDHHDPAAAAEQLRAFVAHHAADPRAEDAAYLLIIALQRVPDPDGVRAAARDYLRAYPGGLRRSSVEPLAH